MTLVNIDLRNQGYETGPDDRVIFYSLLVREGDFGTISTAPVEVPLVDGKGSKDLAPGPVGVQIIAGMVADTRVRIGEVPPSGPTTLGAVMMIAPAYTPALQKKMIDAVEAVAATAVAEITAIATPTMSASRRAEDAAITAESASSQAVAAGEAASDDADQVAADRAIVESAAASSLSARDRAEAAAWKAQLTTAGVSVVEDPPGSGLWAFDADNLAITEFPASSGLYEIGVTNG